MTSQLYEIAVTATAEIRDADGNLVSAEPVASTITVTQEELDQMFPKEKP